VHFFAKMVNLPYWIEIFFFKEIFISWQVCENWKLSPVLLVHADNKCFFYRRKSHAINIPEERQYTWWFESEAGNESGLGWKM
jgi:hypothetical protein